MAFTQAEQNTFGFSEVTMSDKQPLITNGLSRDVLEYELIYQDGYFGEVKEYGGIADGLTGRINIDSDRTIRTEQVEATDTFTVGNTIWFKSGGAGAAGTMVDADSGTDYAAGIITEEEGTAGAQTSVTFRPFAQRLDAADVSAQVITNTAGIATNVTDIGTNVTSIGTLSSLTTTEKTNLVGALNEVDAEADANAAAILVEQAEPKILVFKLTVDASSPVTITGLVEGDEIIAAAVICTATQGSGTLIIEDGAADDITDAMICAVDKVVVYAGTIDDAKSTLPATGAKVLSVGGTAADTRGILVITYIPA